MSVILTYDVDGPHDTPVKNTLMASPYNYKDGITGVKLSDKKTPQTVKLPNTTLYHSSKTQEQASADIVAVAKSCGAKLEKYIVITTNGWIANDPA